MAIFNPEFLTNPAASLNTAFGVPVCITQLTIGALNLLDSNVLVGISNAVMQGKISARDDIAELFEDLFVKMGILSYDSATGQLNLFAVASGQSMDLSLLNELGEVVGALSVLEDLYNQGNTMALNLKACMEEYKSWKKSSGPSEIIGVGGAAGGSCSIDGYDTQTECENAVDSAGNSGIWTPYGTGGSCSMEGYDTQESCEAAGGDWSPFPGAASNLIPGPIGAGATFGNIPNAYTENFRLSQLAIAQQKAVTASLFIEQCNETLMNIGQVFMDRQAEALQQEAGGSCSFPGYNTKTSCEAAGGVWTAVEEPIFRLLYGPPVSKLGVFILSEDGIYYNSQTREYGDEDIPSPWDIGVVIDSETWKLNYPPNLGGKGTIVTVDDINKYVDTFFDPNKIDESLTTWYDYDHFLSVLESQKQKLLFDTSGQITELLSSGYSEQSALILNYRQNLLSVISSFTEKINKRKKQIEIAVKATAEFGADISFELGEIPINDFSYLSSVNLSV